MDPQKVYLDDNGEPITTKVYLDENGDPIVSAKAPVQRGGLTHPLTSVIAPELESARGALNAATEAPHGQPIMARSRTGTLYPSEEGTGALNAAKGAIRGGGGALIDQAEGLTSPLGITGILAGAGSRLMQISPVRSAVRGTLRMTGSALEAPITNLALTPRAAHLGKLVNGIADSIGESGSSVPVDRYMANSGGMAASETPTAASARIPYAQPSPSVGTMAPKPAYSAADVLKIQSLMKQGVSQDMAVRILQQAKQGITSVQ